MAMMLTDGGERIPDFYNESPDASLSQLSLDGSSPPVQLTPLGRQQEVTGPILTKEGLVAAIAELTASKNAAVAEEDFEKAQYYKGQISQYQAVLKNVVDQTDSFPFPTSGHKAPDGKWTYPTVERLSKFQMSAAASDEVEYSDGQCTETLNRLRTSFGGKSDSDIRNHYINTTIQKNTLRLVAKQHQAYENLKAVSEHPFFAVTPELWPVLDLVRQLRTTKDPATFGFISKFLHDAADYVDPQLDSLRSVLKGTGPVRRGKGVVNLADDDDDFDGDGGDGTFRRRLSDLYAERACFEQGISKEKVTGIYNQAVEEERRHKERMDALKKKADDEAAKGRGGKRSAPFKAAAGARFATDRFFGWFEERGDSDDSDDEDGTLGGGGAVASGERAADTVDGGGEDKKTTAADPPPAPSSSATIALLVDEGSGGKGGKGATGKAEARTAEERGKLIDEKGTGGEFVF